MSLFRRIWLMVIGLALAAFIGSLTVNTFTARGYLEKQLFIKNKDNATALALSMSQQPDKDEVMMQLLLSALFDNGHYQSIVLTDPEGRIIVERSADDSIEIGAPGWFRALLPIDAEPGIAFIQDGWQQYGTITLASHSKFAYQDLWQGTLQLTAWFMVGGLAAGFLGTLILRLITRPLDDVVAQAHAITERRFISVTEPDVPELKSVVSAMNAMVTRVKQMFAEEASRLDTMRKKLNHEPVSGLPNRDYFMSRLREALENEESSAYGALAFLRMKDLIEINRTLGRIPTDQLLRDIGDQLKSICGSHDKWLPARLNGPDFAILAQNQADVRALAAEVTERMSTLRLTRAPQIEAFFNVGAIRYNRGDAMSAVLSATDQILAQAESAESNGFAVHEGQASDIIALPAETWRTLITEALNEDRIKLVDFPVVTADGKPIHREGLIRMQTEADGPWRPAGDFMHYAVRLDLSATLDLGVVRLALRHLRDQEGDFAVNLTAEAIANWNFHNELLALLRSEPTLCPRLWVEVPEYGVFTHFDAFRELCTTLKPLGCRIGIEHFGRKLSEVNKLADIGVDYVKVDSGFIRGIDQSEGNQEFLKGLCKMVHSIGILVIAVGVRNQQEVDTIVALGFDGATGPAVMEPNGTT